MDIKVKVEYNPEYTGGEVTGSSNITFSFKEADSKLDNDENPVIENDTVISKDDKTITYDCEENGGTENQTSIFDVGSLVDLNVQCTKQGYTFLGWNTDKDATTVLNSYTMPNEDKTLYGIYSKKIDITYTYSSGITNISKNTDTRTIYNKTTSVDFTLPTVTLDNDADNTYYELDGWYIGDTKIENPGSDHTYTDSVTVNAKANALPVMRSYSEFTTFANNTYTWDNDTPDYHNDSIRETVTEIEFVDTEEIAPPTINNTTSWDVSAKQNGSVIAWLDGTKIYIGGKGGVIGNSDCSYLFYEFSNLTRIEFNDKFDTSRATNMLAMFAGGNKIQNLNISYFDTSNVTNMSTMFSAWNWEAASFVNRSITNIIFGEKWDTSKVTVMADMFSGQPLKELNLSSFDTTKVTNMYHMFNGCIELTTIYTIEEKFVTTNVTRSEGMFNNTTNLVGGNGTVYDYNNVGKARALIDKPGQVGYFTDGSYPVIRNVSSVSTTNSITLTVDAWIPSGDEIQTIEFSKDNGEHWVTQGDSSIADNIYTFTELDANTSYPIEIRVTSDKGKVTTYRYKKYDKSTGTTIPTNDLLFWGDASNPNNTDTILKNKVNGTDGTMYNFNKTSKSGYNGDDLVFDGVDDYVNVGLAGHDFQNSQSMVAYLKLNYISKAQDIFSNSEGAGGGFWFNPSKNGMTYSIHNGTGYQAPTTSVNADTLYYHTFIGTYDGQIVKIYTDGILTGSVSSSQLNNSNFPFLIGSNPNGNIGAASSAMANMNLKEALLYDRTLTETEVQEITNNFDMKYNGPMTNILTTPTYEEIGNNQIKITYPNGCGSEFTCTYKINDSTHNVNDVQNITGTNVVTLTYTSAGSITAEVIGTVNSQKNSTRSSYNLTWNDLYVSSTGNDTTGYGTLSAPYATMNKAYQSAKNTSTIYIMDDITTNETTNFNSNKTITLTSSDSSGNTGSSIVNTVTRGSSLTSYVIDETSGELTLENITVDGDNIEAQAALLSVYHSVSTMETNTIITKGKNYNGYGANIKLFHGTLNINDGEISNGDVGTVNGGGGIWTNSSSVINMNGGIIKNNKARVGGGILLQASSLTMLDGEIYNNTAINNGGGIEGNGTVIISGGEVSNNTAVKGGGIYSGGTLTISGGEVSNNTATTYGGGIYTTGSGTISGGEISNNVAGISGGGIFATGSGTVTISGTSLINKNKANGSSDSGGGGGIKLASGKKLNMNGGTISENTANYVGGGVCSFNSTLTINDGIISGNISPAGGGVHLWQSTMTMTAGVIENNTATNYGGGISATEGSSLTMLGGEISNNTATNSGGGIFATGSGTVTISGTSLINKNKANGNTNADGGGGIALRNGKELNVTGGTISENITNYVGGGISSFGSTLTISGGVISGNISPAGGGVHLWQSTMTMTAGVIENNTATDYGGGVTLSGNISNFIMNGGRISNNTATNNNGGIHSGNDTTFTYNSGVICENTPSNSYETHATCPAS